MSSWIEESGNLIAQERKEAEQRRIILAQSNFWHQIILQIRSDVEVINKDANWKAVFNGHPLEVENMENGIRVAKATLPAIILQVVNKSQSLDVTISRVVKTDGPWSKIVSMDLPLIVQDDLIYVSDGTQLYLVPERVSQFLLSTLLEQIRKELTH